MRLRKLLTRLLEYARGSGATATDLSQESDLPLSEEQKEAMRRGQFSSGVETDEDDIDDILYR